jgi:ClpP class serine protease
LNFKYVNPYAASAAFGLASTGHEIRAMSSSGYGSNGTVMMQLDQSNYDEKLGVTWTPIFAGAKKVDGNPMVSTAIRGIQGRLKGKLLFNHIRARCYPFIQPL